MPSSPACTDRYGAVMLGLPRISTSATADPFQHHLQSTRPPALTPPTSLPSFAAFKHHTTVGRIEDVDGPVIEPMSSRLSCHVCTELNPLVNEAAAAVAELDESVQTYCSSRPSSQAFDVPADCPIRAVQWILDRLRWAKQELRDAARRPQPGYYSQQQQESRHFSPPNPLKRPAETWERDDPSFLKRPRSGASTEQPFYLPAYIPREHRQASVDLASNRRGYSPPLTESVPGSAYPTLASPGPPNRNGTRALLSPSSLAYPPSAAPSLPPNTALSASSPTTSYQPTSSIYTSASSATSAHIADLQHEVTLKSLKLQTLKSEYELLLQKLQREKVKSQTIEKKTNVADQEVNDLTSRNEDLTEQVKTLESQLEECEKRREAERAEAAREKEQWGRMLDMGGRLHAKIDSDRQRLVEEKAILQQRFAVFEREGLQGSGQTNYNTNARTAHHPVETGSLGDSKPGHDESRTEPILAEGTKDVETSDLTQTVKALNARIETLRQALEEARRVNREAEGRIRGFLELHVETGKSFDDAIQHDEEAKMGERERKNARDHDSGSEHQKPVIPSPFPAPPPPSLSRPHHFSTPNASKGTLEVIKDGKKTTAIVAEVARPVSAGPEELGFHVQPSTSSPEELIRALGPVPAPLPPHPFVPQGYNTLSWSHNSDEAGSRTSKSGSEQHQPTSAPSIEGRNRPAGSSPRSNSSYGETNDRLSLGSGAHTPEAYASEPEHSSPSISNPARSHSALPPLRLETSGSPYFCGNHAHWRMPPPPRPEAHLQPHS